MIQKIVIDGTTYPLGVQPVAKTEEMILPVGMDGDGKLWTASLTAPQTWAEIQMAVRAGVIGNFLSVGDQLKVNHAVFGELLLDVIGIDHDTPTDPGLTHSLTLQCHYLLPENSSTTRYKFCPSEKTEDAEGNTNPDTVATTEGNSDWSVSPLRLWLNSTAGAGEWFVPHNAFANTPAYAEDAGFLNGLDAELVSVLGNVDKLTSNREKQLITTADKVFLLSKVEINALPDAAGVYDGSPYAYYAEYPEHRESSNNSDPYRIKTNQSSGTAKSWRLRTAYANTKYHYVKHAGKDGAAGVYDHSVATDSYRFICPAFCIV